MAQTCVPSIHEQMKEHCCKFEANLGYIVLGQPGLSFKNMSQNQTKKKKKSHPPTHTKSKRPTRRLDEVGPAVIPALVEAGELGVQGYPQLHSELEINLSFM